MGFVIATDEKGAVFLKIVVCIKQVVDVAFPFDLDSETCEIALDDLFYIVNPADLCAAEAALKMKEATNGQIIYISLGPSRVERALRKSMAFGGDEAIHILCEEAMPDSRIVAHALSRIIKPLIPDIVVCGSRSLDNNESEIPAFLAEWLDFPQLTGITAWELYPVCKQMRVERKLERGRRVALDCRLPAVVSIEPEAESPRYVTLPDIMHAARSDVKRIDFKELESEESIHKLKSAKSFVHYSLPRPRPKKQFVFNSELSADERMDMMMSGPIKKETRLLEGNPVELAEKIMQIIKSKVPNLK
ncbi:MAG: electron transfer flavoprotein subunit beta/FixA family protein [Desulfobacterales bacterium]